MATETRKVKASFPNRPKGAEMDVPGLGTLVNGESTDVRKDKYDRYAQEHEGWSGSFPYEPTPMEPSEPDDYATGAVAGDGTSEPARVADATGKGGSK